MLIDSLKAIQAKHQYLPAAELAVLAEREKIPLYQIQSVASFYPHFRLSPPPELEVLVCTDLSCHLRGAPELHAALANRYAAQAPRVVVRDCSCLGQCDRAPAVSANHRVLPASDRAALFEQLNRLVRAEHGAPEQPMGGALEHASKTPVACDPYAGGVLEPYALFREYERQPDPERLLAALKESGLRGMGGAGFPAGTKWEIVRRAQGGPKYVVCNADESEPGTFKDREIMACAPHLVLEGMLLAARVVGATEAIIYIRHEYASQRAILERERERCVALGLIDAEPDGPRGLWLRLFESPGGYICGEETALLEALEGKRAEPRNKPPFPGTYGLFGQPTLIHNVETLALVPVILSRGAEWFRAQGRNGATGVKFIALSGDVERPGVYEVPFGITVRELIETHGGGLLGRRPLKAFMPGGASSGFLPAGQLDVPLEFGALLKAGSMLGSGAVVAIAEPACMLDLALNVVRFFRNESCGKCVPCRTGSQQLVRILEGFRRGEGSREDVELIQELNETMKATSICGLGQVAAAPIVSALKYWGDEILGHVAGRRCSTGVCPVGAKR